MGGSVGWGGAGPPKHFAKVDLLPIENDNEKKKVAKNHFKFLKNYW